MDNQKTQHRLIDLGLSLPARAVVDKILEHIGGQRQSVDSVQACQQLMEHAGGPLSLILDIDAVDADASLFRRLSQLNPDCKILVLSPRCFHPELKEAMRRNIFAVINTSGPYSEELQICLQALVEGSQDIHRSANLARLSFGE